MHASTEEELGAEVNGSWLGVAMVEIRVQRWMQNPTLKIKGWCKGGLESSGGPQCGEENWGNAGSWQRCRQRGQKMMTSLGSFERSQGSHGTAQMLGSG